MADEIDEVPRLRPDSDGEDEDDEAAAGANRLPWGVRKKLVEKAPPGCEVCPQVGDEVSVHFVAKLQSGKEIGASRDDAKPFRFVIGQQPRQVVEGFELGVQTMRRGEIAEFTVAPRYAYDDLGSPPLVPPDATMVFEVELLDFECKVDLFRDDRAVKTLVKRGTGTTRPVLGQSVLMTLRVRAKTGKVAEEYGEAEHVVGAADFGPSSRIVTRALLGMLEGEQASVRLRRFAGDALVDRTLQGATLEIGLLRVYEARDISPEQDGSLVKKVLHRGTGHAPPSEASRVTLSVEEATDGGAAPIASFTGRQALEFKLGNGEVCDALELAAAEMRLGERAALTCLAPALCAEPRLGLAGLQVQRVVLILQLTSLAEDVDAAALPMEERLSFVAERRVVAAALFNRQRYRLALERYSRMLALIGLPGEEEEVRQLCCTCELNRAACLLKLEDNAGARAACNRVLTHDPNQVKGLYRRGAACFALSDYASAQKDLLRVLRLDPKNAEARDLLLRVREAQKHYAEEARSTAARMCGTQPSTALPAALVEGELAGKASSCIQFLRPLAACLSCFPLPCGR
uniref:peptidylprolyl isomerase n=1 Tax=Alexandrium monilatum TaxID=311494 RepID=A0A7S4VD41_9DINO|mmetsp:Transcript_11213/g.35604  ORF Transcript_11213/g.35604 Transcript_11213/m.35604 type:complete len:574 (+) Transcript_11213:41-1762(+)